MNKSEKFIAIIFILAIAVIYYSWQQTEETQSIQEDAAVMDAENYLDIPNDDVITIKHPVPEIPTTAVETQENEGSKPEVSSENTLVVTETVELQVSRPLPLLDEIDNAIAAAIIQLTDVTGLFSFNSFVRHFVVTIDNMTSQKIPQRYIFTQRVPEKFSVIKQDDDTVLLDEKNFLRYEKFVSLAEHIDTRKLAVQYVRFYPLFQESYEELGYPDRYFNDRFIQVIEHLLAAPEVKGAIRLVRPKVFYHFAKPELESLSAGQKILIRIGYDNSQRVKAKLRELRTVLTDLPAQ